MELVILCIVFASSTDVAEMMTIFPGDIPGMQVKASENQIMYLRYAIVYLEPILHVINELLNHLIKRNL